VTETFRQEYGSEMVRDGMDIALCALDRNEMKLHFSGANNPIYIIRESELTEIKGDKFPIGNYGGSFEHRFGTHTFSLKKGDSIYIFSDGYADQLTICTSFAISA